MIDRNPIKKHHSASGIRDGNCKIQEKGVDCHAY